MPSQLAQQIIIPMPVKGVDQGAPFNAQPIGTCPDALNARALYAASGRTVVGKRPGHSKVFSTAVTGAARVNGLFGFDNTPQEAIGSDSPPATETLDPTVPSTGNDIGAGWLQIDFIGGRAGLNIAGQSRNYHVQAKDSAFHNITAGDKLQMQNTGVGNTNAVSAGIASQYKTTNSATLVLYATGTADGTSDAGGANDGPTNSCVRIGPFIRGAATLDQAIVLHFRHTAPNTVRLHLSAIQPSGITDIWSSAGTFGLGGLGAQTDCTMTLSEVSSTVVRVAVEWPTQAISFTEDVVTSTFSGNNRAGASFLGGSGTRTHECSSLSVVGIRQSSGGVAQQIAATDMNTVGSQQFFVPDAFTAVRHIRSTNTTTSQAGPAQSATVIPGTCIDTTNDTIEASASVGSSDMYALVHTTNPAARRAVGVTIGSQVAANSVGFSFYTRVADDFKSYVKVELNVDREGSSSEMVDIEGSVEITVVSNSVVIGTQTEFLNFGASDTYNLGGIVWREGDAVVLADDGTDGDTVFRLYINGLLLLSFTLLSTLIGSAAAAGLYSGGVGGTAWRRCGAGSSVANGEVASIAFYDVGLSPTGGDASTSPSFGMATTYLAAFSDGDVDAGNLESLTLSRCAGAGFTSSVRCQASALSRKMYCVNGSQSLVVDPINLTVTEWAATAGTLPAGCKLVATYRGRIVLANQATSPGIYYMSRVLNPLDWDFGAAPEETAAVAGTNTDFGQPGSAITCLIPYSDDYLFFGCGASLWMMEGDPGAGGAVQNLSYQTGIAGPRAWTFDEDANLWFVGQAGLWVIRRGTLIPENVSGERISAFLDTVDFDSNLIQLAYNANRREIGIFVTPSNGTSVGTHIVYDIDRDGIWLDQYPLAHGPWSAMSTTGTNDIDRNYLFGGNDGYIRRPDEDAFSDDGTSITSFIRFAPVEAEEGHGEVRLTEIQADAMGGGSGSLNWYLMAGESAAQVNQVAFGSASSSGTWSGTAVQFQTPARLRQRAPAHQLLVRQASSTLTWAMERASIWAGEVGRRR